ncbi:MAG: HEAT repeat domain-containing protein [Planctomycetota bacterium]
MQTSLRILLPIVVLSGCSTTSESTSSTRLEDEFLQPNAIVRQEIDKRIREIPFQHQDNLLSNLLWLSERGEVAIPQLLGSLNAEEPKVRSSTAWVLGQIRERRVVPRLRPLLEDDNESVRLEVARVLMQLGDFSAAPTLIAGLDSDSPAARYKCSEGLKLTTGRDVAFDHLTDDQAARAEAVLRWREWWAKQSNDPFFHDSYAEAHGLPTLADQASQRPTSIDPSEVPAQPAGDLMQPQSQGQNQGDSNTTEESVTAPQTNETPLPAFGFGSAGSSTETSGSETPATEDPTTEDPTIETPTTEDPTSTPSGTTENSGTTPSSSPFDWLRRRAGSGSGESSDN